VALAPRHFGALHGLGAARFALDRVQGNGGGGGGGEPSSRSHHPAQEGGREAVAPQAVVEAWSLALEAFDSDSFRVRGQVVAYAYPDDPPLVRALRHVVGRPRVIQAPASAPRAPVWASAANHRAWQAENDAAAKDEAYASEANTPPPPLSLPYLP
jgi:hypothetical protein